MKSVLTAVSFSLVVMLTACSNVVTSSPGSDPSASQVPSPPVTTNASFAGKTTVEKTEWLHAARKTYLNVLFSMIRHERVAAAAFFPHDAVLDVTGYQKDLVPLSGSYQGKRQITGYFRDLFKAIDVTRLFVEYQLAQDSYVSSHIKLYATVRSTGKRVDMELVYLFKFGRDGRIEHCRVYYDTQLWYRAFQNGGPLSLTDIQNPTEDFKILPTKYDVAALVKTLYDNFYAGNISTVMSMLSPDVAVYFKGDKQTYPYAGIYHGFTGALQFIQDLAGTAAPYNVQRFQVTEGDRTDMVLFEEWTVFATGKSYHVNTVNSWRVDSDGLLLGFTNYPDSLEIAQAYAP